MEGRGGQGKVYEKVFFWFMWPLCLDEVPPVISGPVAKKKCSPVVAAAWMCHFSCKNLKFERRRSENVHEHKCNEGQSRTLFHFSHLCEFSSGWIEAK